MIVTQVEDVYIEDDEIICMFPSRYKGVEHDNIVTQKDIEIDSDLGLEVVSGDTIQSKYGITLEAGNTFHESLQKFFDRSGFLTEKQLKCFR